MKSKTTLCLIIALISCSISKAQKLVNVQNVCKQYELLELISLQETDSIENNNNCNAAFDMENIIVTLNLNHRCTLEQVMREKKKAERRGIFLYFSSIHFDESGRLTRFSINIHDKDGYVFFAGVGKVIDNSRFCIYKTNNADKLELAIY